MSKRRYNGEFEKENYLNPWRNSEALSQEINTKAVPIDYSELINTEDSSVLLLGNLPAARDIRIHLANNAKLLKNAGITHYAIEAIKNSAFDQLNNGQQVDLKSVMTSPLYRIDKTYEKAVLAMAAEGIKIVPIDTEKQQISSRERNKYMAHQIHKILEEDNEARIAVLINANHVDKKTPNDVANLLIQSDASVLSANYVTSKSETPKFFMNATRNCEKATSNFMLDLRPYEKEVGVVFGAGRVDYIIHLAEDSSNQKRLLGGPLGDLAVNAD